MKFPEYFSKTALKNIPEMLFYGEAISKVLKILENSRCDLKKGRFHLINGVFPIDFGNYLIDFAITS